MPAELDLVRPPPFYMPPVIGILIIDSFHLVRNPQLIDRLKSEIAEAGLPKFSELTRKQIQQLPFLRCCLNESTLVAIDYPRLPSNPVHQRYVSIHNSPSMSDLQLGLLCYPVVVVPTGNHPF